MTDPSMSTYERSLHESGRRQGEREAMEHLRKLVDWGHGEDAPDAAVADWNAARAFLDQHMGGKDGGK